MADKLSKVGLLALTILLPSLILGCSDLKSQSSDVNRSKKLELSGTTWYDYGNGLINLSNITRITSTASVQAVVMPKEYFINENRFYDYLSKLSDEDEAIVIAHADYCFDSLKASSLQERYSFSWNAFSMNASLGSFETGKAGEKLAEQVVKMKSYITPEFAENCVIRLSGTADLQFDGFSVTMEPFEINLSFYSNKDGKFLKHEIDRDYDKMVGELKKGKTPWNGTYTSLIKR